MNIWIPDGSKDQPYDRFGPRRRLIDALDEVIAIPIPARSTGTPWRASSSDRRRELHSRLQRVLPGLRDQPEDHAVLGHRALHPTEVVSDKLSAALGFVDDILLQLSRGVRWDSDHVVLLDDETQAIANEIVRGGVLDRIAFGLDSSTPASTASPPG